MQYCAAQEKTLQKESMNWLFPQIKPGGPALWGDTFKRALDAHVKLGCEKLIGVLHPESGAPSRVPCSLVK